MNSSPFLRVDQVEHWLLDPAKFDSNDAEFSRLESNINRAATDPTLRAIVAVFRHPAPDKAETHSDLNREASRTLGPEDIDRVYGFFMSMPQVVMAVVDAMLGPTSIGLICGADVCLCSDAASFVWHSSSPRPASGHVMSAMLTRRLGATRGPAWLRQGDTWDAHRAWDEGLVHEAVAAHALDAAIQQTLAAYLRVGPQAVARSKSLMRQIQSGVRQPATRDPGSCRQGALQVLADVDLTANLRPPPMPRPLPWGERRR